MNNERYKILLNKDWNLEDLYEFPHAYSQAYSLTYCLNTELPWIDHQRIDTALVNYPWNGGYSYVNIYHVFKAQIPESHRPLIISIQKASPGWLELSLILDVAIDVAKAVSLLAASISAATLSYRKMQKTLSAMKADREKSKYEELKYKKMQIGEMNAMCDEMARFIGFRRITDLHKKTGDPEISLKILLAHYRRLHVLYEYQDSGKINMVKEMPNRQ